MSLCALLSTAIASGADTPRYNVLFLMSDDLRPELSSYGCPGVRTPHIDALAKAGVRFDRAYCQFPLCNPSRTSMLTGRYPTTTGVLENTTNFRVTHPDYITLPQFFKANGYVTLRSGKIFHGGMDDPLAWTQGGDHDARNASAKPRNARRRTAAEVAARRRNSDRIVILDGEGESHADYKTTQNAIALLNQHKDERFFLACGWVKPHSPPTAPKRYFDLYDADKIALPADFAPRVTVPPGFPPGCLTSNGDLFINRDATPAEAREVIRAYRASLTWMDHNVGLVLDELDRLNLRDKTIILFWGDHGYHLGEKGKWSKHNSLFEVGARVPLLISAPGRAGNGRDCERLVEAIDIYPTLTALCGLPTPMGLQGDSLVPLLDDPAAAWDKPAFTVTHNAGSVREGRWRYAEWGPNGEDGAMLVDEIADPTERTNLADRPEQAETRARLSALLKTLEPAPQPRRAQPTR